MHEVKSSVTEENYFWKRFEKNFLIDDKELIVEIINRE